MVKRKTKNTNKDKFGTFMLIMAILSGFLLISYVEASYENDKENVLLFNSNSATSFPSYEKVGWGFPTTPNETTSLNIFTPILQYEKTPVYIGNETWSIPINSTTTGQSGTAQYVIKLPNLNNWIIDEIIINQTKNTDSDLLQRVIFYSIDSTTERPYGQPAVIVYDADDGSGDIWNNKTIDLNLGESLDIFDKANSNIEHFVVITYIDSNNDGLSSFAWNMKIEITGKK